MWHKIISSFIACSILQRVFAKKNMYFSNSAPLLTSVTPSRSKVKLKPLNKSIPPPNLLVFMLFYFNFFSSQAPPLARWQQRTHLCIVRQHLFEREEPQREILSWAAAGIISSLGEGVCCLSVCQLHTLSTPSSLPTFSSCTPLSRRKHANLKICTKIFAQNHLVNGKGGIFPSIRHCSVGPSFFLPFWV